MKIIGLPVPVLKTGWYSGAGKISGTVKEHGASVDAPVHRKVRLFDERSGFFIDETWSDPVTGNYVFTQLRVDIAYTVISYDYTKAFRAVVADRLVPKVAP